MQFEQPTYTTQFAYPGNYAYANPTSGMPPTAQAFAYDPGYPTPAPSPHSPGSRRRSNTHSQQAYMGGEYASGKRPGSSRRHESGEYAGYASPPYASTTSPRPGSQHRGAAFMHTPLHTPPPSAHGHHTPMPNIYSYVPGFSPSAPPHEYFYHPAPGPHSPPPGLRSAEGRRSRSHHHRRADTWTEDTHARRSPPKPTRTATAPVPDHNVNEKEAFLRKRAEEEKIPKDYSLKNWDPTERPIILLGSVFDANSLGEWIFNWTKYHHGRNHEATRTAGGLWELLIELSSKIKRAEEFYSDIRKPENKEILREFRKSGDRLWDSLKALLRSCEEYMWTGARRVNSPDSMEGKAKVQMGRQSGAEFVEAMFMEDKEWHKTERLIRGIAVWCQRFTVNCEDILRDPTS